MIVLFYQMKINRRGLKIFGQKVTIHQIKKVKKKKPNIDFKKMTGGGGSGSDK